MTRGSPIVLQWRDDFISSSSLVTIYSPIYLFGAIKTESACLSKPNRPALPTICLYCAVDSYYPVPTLHEAITTRLAGRLTPVASVVVQKRVFKSHFLKRCSEIILSSRLSPEWWKARPFMSICLYWSFIEGNVCIFVLHDCIACYCLSSSNINASSFYISN